VHRAGRVGRHELEVQPLARQGLGAAVGGTRGHGVDRDLPERTLREGDVQEAGAGHVDTGDARLRTQLLGEQLGHLARWPAGRLGQTEGDVGGVVAVLAVLRALDDDLVGRLDGEHASADRPAHGGPDDVLQLLGCHRTSVLTRVRGSPGRSGSPGRRAPPT
jgi:hypothetical protein